jgi:hypothetical protein
MNFKKRGDKTMNKLITIIFMIFTFGLSGAFAQKTETKCMIRGWVQDKEPRKSISLYKVPDPMYVATHNDGIVGAIDNSTEQGEEKPVEIIGFNTYPEKLIRIRKATDLSNKILFEGDGWIEAERITARAWSSDGKALTLYSKPRLSSSKIGTIPNKTFLKIIGFDCFGLKVNYKGKSGWLSAKQICSDPRGGCQ